MQNCRPRTYECIYPHLPAPFHFQVMMYFNVKDRDRDGKISYDEFVGRETMNERAFKVKKILKLKEISFQFQIGSWHQGELLMDIRRFHPNYSTVDIQRKGSLQILLSIM